MNVLTVMILAFGLSMDAFAVSICNCLCYKKFEKKDIAISAFSYGLFQGVMPLLGFLLGTQFLGMISSLDHWLALIMLSFIGGKMIIDSFTSKDEDIHEEKINFRTLIVQSVATSIDALAVGISFAALQVNIWFAAAVIAFTTFLNCCVGGFLGKRFGKLLGNQAQLIGGLILIVIGIKIFVEHIFG